MFVFVENDLKLEWIFIIIDVLENLFYIRNLNVFFLEMIRRFEILLKEFFREIWIRVEEKILRKFGKVFEDVLR